MQSTGGGKFEQLAKTDDRASRKRQAERERLQRLLADVARRQETVLRQVQDGDPDDPFARGLRGTYNDLEAQKTAALAAMRRVDEAEQAEPARSDPSDLALLDALPVLKLNLVHAPTNLLRRLFDVTRLEVRLDGDGGGVDVTISLPAADIDAISSITRAIDERGDAPPVSRSYDRDKLSDARTTRPGRTLNVYGRVDVVRRRRRQSRTDATE